MAANEKIPSNYIETGKDYKCNKWKKTKLLVRLKLLPKDIRNSKKRQLQQTLKKVVRYKVCLHIEKDDGIKDKIKTETKDGKQHMEIANEGINKLAYSYFRKMRGSVSDLQLSQGNENDKNDFVCEITVDEIDKPDSDSDSHSDSESYSETPSDSDYAYLDYCDTDDDNAESSNGSQCYDVLNLFDLLKNRIRAEPKVSDGNNDHNPASILSKIELPHTVSKVIIRHPQSKKLSKNKKLTFKDACDTITLQKKIYKALTKEYDIDHASTDAFYIRMSLGILNENYGLKHWHNSDLKEVIRFCITEYEAIYLEELLNAYKPTEDVKKAIETVAAETSSGETSLQRISDCYFDLFMDAIANKKFKASLIYWSYSKNLIGHALVAISAIEHFIKEEKNQDKLNELKEYREAYQKYATDILTKCYKEDSSCTWKLLRQKMPHCKQSCITIALSTKNMSFIQQEACIQLNNFIWASYEEQENILDVKKDCLNSTRDWFLTPIGKCLNTLGELFLPPNEKCLCRIREWFLSPKGKCSLDMVGYLLFLTAYSVLLVSQLNVRTFHWLEAVVVLYILVFLIKECDKYHSNSRYRLNFFNILDILGIIAALFAWILRWVAYCYPDDPRWMDASRYVFIFDFMFYMLRFLEFFYVSKFLGPITVMIRQMVKTFCLFLLILLLFLVTYSVASESLLYPETELNSETLYYVFRKGFWAMIGEYSLDELEATEDQCTSDPALYNNHTVLRCPSANARYFVPVMLGAYSIFIQLLMFSLVIALFNYDVAQNVSERDGIWSFQKFKLTSQYALTRILLPPFTFLFFLYTEDPFIKDDKNSTRAFEQEAALSILHLLHDRVKKDEKKKSKKESKYDDHSKNLLLQLKEIKEEMKDLIPKVVHETLRLQQESSRLLGPLTARDKSHGTIPPSLINIDV